MSSPLELVLRKLPTGIYIVTAGRGEDARVLTNTWITQITTDPPRVMMCLRPYRKQQQLLASGEPFCIHLLGADQYELCLPYVESEPVAGPEFARREGEAPLRREAAAYVDCIAEGQVKIGDHDMFWGRVVGGEILRNTEILTTAHFGDPYRSST